MTRRSRSLVSCRLKLWCLSMQSAKPAYGILIVLWIVSSRKLSIRRLGNGGTAMTVERRQPTFLGGSLVYREPLSH
jgi:hypothetical protein